MSLKSTVCIGMKYIMEAVNKKKWLLKTIFLMTPTKKIVFFYNFFICISIDSEWSKTYD